MRGFSVGGAIRKGREIVWANIGLFVGLTFFQEHFRESVQ